jgi:hypothetical protein
VAACLMAMCEGLSAMEALERTQTYHDVRLETSEYPCKVYSPQRPSQRQQVKRLVDRWRAEHPPANRGLEEDQVVAREKKLRVSVSFEGAGCEEKVVQEARPRFRRVGSVSETNTIDYMSGVRESFQGSFLQKSPSKHTRLTSLTTPPNVSRQPPLRGKQKILFSQGRSPASPSSSTSVSNQSSTHSTPTNADAVPSLPISSAHRFTDSAQRTSGAVRVPVSPTRSTVASLEKMRL